MQDKRNGIIHFPGKQEVEWLNGYNGFVVMAGVKRVIIMLKNAVSTEQLNQIRKLYEASFPKAEKKPFELMVAKQKEGLCEILAIEDETGNFCGLAIMILAAGLALLDYFAIEPRCQGGGLGSVTLRELRERYGSDKIVVEIERTTGPEAEAAENAQERIRRKAFYLRNGMVPMEFLVDLFGVEMEVLTFGRKLTYEEYYAIYDSVLPKHMTDKVRLA